jgi:hypothetical protein
MNRFIFTSFLALSLFGCSTITHSSQVVCQKGFDFCIGLTGLKLSIGTNINIDKYDHVVIVINQDSTIINTENLNQEIHYNDGKPVVEIRSGDLERPITYVRKKHGKVSKIKIIRSKNIQDNSNVQVVLE